MRTILLLAVVTTAGCLFRTSDGPNAEPGDDASNSDGVIDGPQCGNGVLDVTERCDDSSPNDAEQCRPCPPNPPRCRENVQTGSALTCDLLCDNVPPQCSGNADGCCPSVATCGNDPDCVPPAGCGDAVVDGDEACDPGIPSGPGACPSDEDCEELSDSCTIYLGAGEAVLCNAVCVGFAEPRCDD